MKRSEARAQRGVTERSEFKKTNLTFLVILAIFMSGKSDIQYRIKVRSQVDDLSKPKIHCWFCDRAMPKTVQIGRIHLLRVRQPTLC